MLGLKKYHVKRRGTSLRGQTSVSQHGLGCFESRAERSTRLFAAPDISLLIVDVALNLPSLKTLLLNHTSKLTNDPSTIDASDFYADDFTQACFDLHERDLLLRPDSESDLRKNQP